MDKSKKKEDKKYITYGGIKEISDIDLDFSPESPSLIDMLIEAKKHAYAENIKANSIVINKNFVKTPYLIFEDGILPPMICGLEVYFTTDELPKNYAFAVLEKNKTERELIIEKASKETAEEILQGVMKWLNQAISDSYNKSVCGSTHDGGRNTAFHEVKDLVKKVAESKGVEVE